MNGPSSSVGGRPDAKDWPRPAASVLLWLSAAALAVWTRWSVSGWLLASALAGALGVLRMLAGGRGRNRWVLAAAVVLLAGIASGILGSSRFGRVAGDWDRFRVGRDARLEAALDERLEALTARGTAAVARVAGRELDGASPGYWAFLEDVRRESDLQAVAVFDARTELVAWAGNHQGVLPLEARSGWDRFVYGQGPVYSHLYFSERVGASGATAVAVALLQSDMPPDVPEEESAFATRFQSDVGSAIRVTRSEQAAGPVIRDFNWRGEALFSISFEEVTQRGVFESARRTWSRVVASLAVTAWLLLLIGLRATPHHAPLAATTLAVLAAVLPFGDLLGVSGLFSPAGFLLPGTTEGTLGRVLALGLAGVFIAGFPWRPPRGRGALVPGAVLAGIGFAAVIHWFSLAPTTSQLGGRADYWLVYQCALTTVLVLVAGLALRLAHRPAPTPARPSLVAAGLLLALVLGLLVNLRSTGAPPPPAWAGALWALPVGLTALGLRPAATWRGSLATAAATVVLAASAALPFTWGGRVAAQLEVAGNRLSTLGNQVDPYLQFLLEGLSETTDSLYESGAGGTGLLYGTWRASGLAQEGVPVWIGRWTPDGLPSDDLRIGVSEPRPPIMDDYLDEAAAGATVLRLQSEDVHYLGLATLPDGSVITVAVPPRRGFGRALSPDVPFGGDGVYEGTVTLMPLNEGDPVPTERAPRWGRIAQEWRGEQTILFPEGWYSAHYTMELPGIAVLVAGVVLVLLADLLIVVGLWGMGWWSGRGRPRAPIRLGPDAGRSFRVQVTLALFAFFLIPALAFAAIASRTLDGAAVRTAEALADRAVANAAESFLAVQGDAGLLPARAGTVLLLYQDGELVRSSRPAFLELGVQHTWLPARVHRSFTDGDAVLVHANSRRWGEDYVLAYRRLQTGQVLASEAPLDAGATAFEQNDLVLLLAFAIVTGIALSLGLALLVGRRLANPIRTLRLASERVGHGNLEVRLPETRTDEFGTVFLAFNRMVRRLHRARGALVRTTQRTQAIVEEAATGVIALDQTGKVTLVNPQAQVLLGASVGPGEPLPATRGLARDLSRWVERFYRDGGEGADHEFELSETRLAPTAAGRENSERRIRVRARRITRDGPSRGVVLSLEDVTDELRSERIVAWGQMARQVAHEVKNPLTPIKLSIEHVRRAWQDRRRDFSEILERNVASILREIDRLAEIARSFSRYGSPAKASDVPLEGVRLDTAVGDILALYQSDEQGIVIDTDLPAELPPVRAREAEFKEVLVNLLENAREAVKPSGGVHIGATAEDGEVCLQVRDDGRGIERELLGRIFEPRFSTSSTGTGLGLAIVQRLVRSWGARVWAESTPGAGTTMSIRFVAWEPAADALAAAAGSGRAVLNPQD